MPTRTNLTYCRSRLARIVQSPATPGRRPQQQQRQQRQYGVTNDRVGGSRVSRPLIPRVPLLSPQGRAGCPSRVPSRHRDCVPLARHARPAIHPAILLPFVPPLEIFGQVRTRSLAIATTSQRRRAGHCAAELEGSREDSLDAVRCPFNIGGMRLTVRICLNIFMHPFSRVRGELT